ncbi:general odorant-binding protein 19d-like isoform X2 [Epargyreus clarus]|uniref:general odorant-binding protein 19d-like isoform X2 n=1 Tax=Epargyreus clarus TaxID=520877 RepID=UPI003C2EDDAF
MFAPTLGLCCLYFLAVTPLLTYAMTDEQKTKIHEEFQALGLECMKDHVLTEDDIKNLQAHKIATGENVPCFLACMMKKAGIIDDKGMLQNDQALEQAQKFFDKEEELEKVKDYLHSCSHVNSEPVTDGEKGCDRAFLSYKCMMENASQFGFEM